MVDRETRDQYVDVIERYLDGEIDNLRFDEEADDLTSSSDQGVHRIYWELWFTYCDINRHDAYKNGPEVVELYRRAAAFMRTDLEYTWRHAVLGDPYRLSAGVALLGVAFVAAALFRGSVIVGAVGVSLLLVAWLTGRLELRRWSAVNQEIDWDVWPFASREQMLQYHQPADVQPVQERGA